MLSATKVFSQNRLFVINVCAFLPLNDGNFSWSAAVIPILGPPAANPNNASSNEVVTRQAPVVHNIPSVPIQNLSPVTLQNAGPHPSTQFIPPHNSNEALMSAISSLYTQIVALEVNKSQVVIRFQTAHSQE